MSNGNITMRGFGRYGRWGNQLIQYAFLKCYARMHHLDVQIPPWVGNTLLGACDYPINTKLETVYEPLSGNSQSEPIAPTGTEYVNKDFAGYAQWPTSWYAPHRKYIQCLLQPAVDVASRLAPAAGRLLARGRTRIGLHLRRGDYGRAIFYVTPVVWYLDWLDCHWDALDRPVLFIATESKDLVKEFAAFDPVTVEDLGVNLRAETLPHYNYLGYDRRHPDPRQFDFFPEWYLLTQCEILLTPNSTFSFTAGMASDRLRHFFRSQLPTQRMEEEDIWNASPCQRWHKNDWATVPGVWRESNPYWR
jgi:hypothetical protein